MLPGWNPQKLTQGSWPSNQGSRRQQRWLCLYQLCTASGHNRSLDCASPQGTTAVASKYRNSTREAICLEHHIFYGQMGGSPLLLLVKIKPSPQDHVSSVHHPHVRNLQADISHHVNGRWHRVPRYNYPSEVHVCYGNKETGPRPCEAHYAWCYKRGPRSDVGSQSASPSGTPLTQSNQRGSSVMSQTRWREPSFAEKHS